MVNSVEHWMALYHFIAGTILLAVSWPLLRLSARRNPTRKEKHDKR